ncbi:MAG: NADH-quinone oxidoreductase subunit C [Tepidisphaera sp.]
MTTTPPSNTPSTAYGTPAPVPTLDHPMFARLKTAFAGKKFRGTDFRGVSTVIVEPADLHAVLAFLKNECAYEFLSDVVGLDYLEYPSPQPGRFAVVYNLLCFSRDERFFVKTYLNPSLPTDGIVEDPALYVDSACDLWPGAEWPEREVFDMYGIRFRNHPDLRRILTWEDYPAHPLRKDYPVRGRGEREQYAIVDRSST